jgi:hypothetical protein
MPINISTTQSLAEMAQILATAEQQHTKVKVSEDGRLAVSNWADRAIQWFKGLGKSNDWKTAQLQEGHASVARSLAFAIQRDLGATPASGWDPVSINHRKVSSFIEESLARRQAISVASLVALIQTVKPEFPAVAVQGASSDRSISAPFSGSKITEASAVQSWGVKNERAEHLAKVFSPNPLSSSQADSALYVNFLLDRDQLIADGDPAAKLLTDEQHWAINQYTGSAFTDINRALRDTNSADAQDPRIVGLITHALGGMKVLVEAGLVRQEGVHRGINNYQPTHDLKEGQVYTESSFTSTSDDITIARNFSGESSQMDFATIQHIFGNEGVPVATLSQSMFEAEVLYPIASEFKVLFAADREVVDASGKKGKVREQVLEQTGMDPNKGKQGYADSLPLANTATSAPKTSSHLDHLDLAVPRKRDLP